MRIRRRYRFEASHVLPRHPGRCRNLHGHSYQLVVEVRGAIDEEQGMVLDFADLDAIVDRKVIAELDHRHLNELIDNPTAEWIAVHIWRVLRPEVPGLSAIELHETADASVVYRGEAEEEGEP